MTEGLLHCPKHEYSATDMIPPKTRGCAGCWKVFYSNYVLRTPPEKRDELLTNLERTVREANGLAALGKFDYKPSRHFQVNIEKEK